MFLYVSIFLIFLSNVVANNNARVDDVVNLFNYPDFTAKFPSLHPSLLSNRELDKFFQKQDWRKYTLQDIDVNLY